MDWDSYRNAEAEKAETERLLASLRKRLVDAETVYNEAVAAGDEGMRALADDEIRRLQHLYRYRTGSDFELDLRTPGG